MFTSKYVLVLHAMARPLFSIFLWDGGKRVLSSLQSLFVLAPPTGGGVNDGNVICYCSIVTHAISIVLYKHVSLLVKVEVKSAVSMNYFKVENSVRV